eukprot:UN30565
MVAYKYYVIFQRSLQKQLSIHITLKQIQNICDKQNEDELLDLLSEVKTKTEKTRLKRINKHKGPAKEFENSINDFERTLQKFGQNDNNPEKELKGDYDDDYEKVIDGLENTLTSKMENEKQFQTTTLKGSLYRQQPQTKILKTNNKRKTINNPSNKKNPTNKQASKQ